MATEAPPRGLGGPAFYALRPGGWRSNALAVHTVGEAIAGVGVTLACFWVSVAQRRLSTPVRGLRRRTVALSGEQQLADGTRIELDAAALAVPLEGTLKALSLA